ncbi:T9SS type A sorting domain-containing protein [Cryomorpha ignava]|uniref:T9SS type A sorting domain-containing protein n=1 Tax=Cryomorpha ignava TaxID=101383 RepID=A0A7K3WT58_9FLAO|nr:T9SS type A sorting domain-containing protein [Cryomorpha ignava]NEN24879.1 T9SS type A sorting domain-containing protein [Cryomorpha ignava]
MKVLVGLVLFLFSFPHLRAQWYEVNSNTSEQLNDIFFVDSTTGFCVGGDNISASFQGNGIILKTEDSGENWETIYSIDSLSFQHVAVITESNQTKLLAFASRNGMFYMVSTLLSPPMQDWNIEQINYKPIDVRVYDNKLYLHDALDLGLKRLIDNDLFLIKSQIGMFNVNSYGLIIMNASASNIERSSDFGNTWFSTQTFPPGLNANQFNNSDFACFGDTLIIKATYGSNIHYSNDFGNEWNTVIGGPDNYSLIVSTDLIYGLAIDSNLYYTANFGIDWISQGVYNVNSIHYQYNMGFLLGESGNIFKTNNNGGITGQLDIEGLKKKIDIYPNPAKEILTFQLPEGLKLNKIQLANSNGQIIETLSLSRREIDTSNLAAGIYFLTFETSEGTITEKVVIAR